MLDKITQAYKSGSRNLRDMVDVVDDTSIVYYVGFLANKTPQDEFLEKANLKAVAKICDSRWEEILRLYVYAVDGGLTEFKLKGKDDWTDFCEYVAIENPVFRTESYFKPKARDPRSKKTGFITLCKWQKEFMWALWDGLHQRLYFEEGVGYNHEGKGLRVTIFCILAHRQSGKTEIIACTFSAFLLKCSARNMQMRIASFAPVSGQNFINEHIDRHMVRDSRNFLYDKYVRFPRKRDITQNPSRHIQVHNADAHFVFNTAGSQSKEGGSKHGDTGDVVHVDEMQKLPDKTWHNEITPLTTASEIGIEVYSGTTNLYSGCEGFYNMVEGNRKSVAETGFPMRGQFYMEVNDERGLREGSLPLEKMIQEKQRSLTEYAMNYQLVWKTQIERDFWNLEAMERNVKTYPVLLNDSGEKILDSAKTPMKIYVSFDIHTRHYEGIVGLLDMDKRQYKILNIFRWESKTDFDEDQILNKVIDKACVPYSQHHQVTLIMDAGGADGRKTCKKMERMLIGSPVIMLRQKVKSRNEFLPGFNSNDRVQMEGCEKALNDLFNQCRIHLPNHHFSKQLLSECNKLVYDEKKRRWRNSDKDHLYATARQLMVPVLRAKAIFTEAPLISAGIISSNTGQAIDFATI